MAHGRIVLGVIAAASATACGGSSPTAGTPHAHEQHGGQGHPHGGHQHTHTHDQHGGHPHGEHPHGHGQAPLVHRFEHAAEWAPQFDDPARDAWQRPKDVVEVMGLQSGMTVADVGAGTGYFEPWLSRAVGSAGTVLALDVEADMVRYMTERAAREQLTNVRPALASVDDPKLPPAGVDRILVVDVWHHVPEREAYAAKLRSGLKAGGKVFIVDFKLDAKHGPPPAHRISAEQVARELTAGGLVARVVTSTLPEQYIVEGARP